MTQLLVGTKKGLFVLEGDPGTPFEVTSRAFAGEPVEFAMRDPRTGRNFATVTSAFYGPKVFYTDDLEAEWQQASGLELPENAEKPLERLWTVVPAEDDDHLYAGGAPGVLFESHDNGESWALNQSFWEQPTRPDWSPGAGGMCMHSIATWPGDPKRVALAISAVGVWLTEDGGDLAGNGNKGLYPRYILERHARTRSTSASTTCIATRQSPSGSSCSPRRRVRSDDAGETWTSIADGLSVRLRFPGVLTRTTLQRIRDPARRDLDRTTPEGRVRVYETGMPARRGSSAATGSPRTTPISRSSGRRSVATGRPLDGLYFGATVGRRVRIRRRRQDVVHGATKLPPCTRCGAA